MRTICIGLFIAAVTGVDGAEGLLRDGSGGVGGRYVYKSKHKHPRNVTNVPHHTNLGWTIQRRVRSIRLVRHRQSFQPLVKTWRRHVLLIRQTMVTILAGFHLTNVHLLIRQLILISFSELQPGGRFNSRVSKQRSGVRGSGSRGLLTCATVVSMHESVSRGRDDWCDG